MHKSIKPLVNLPSSFLQLESHVAKAGLELMILLLSPPKFQD